MNSSLVTVVRKYQKRFKEYTIIKKKKCNAVLESTGNMWMRIHDTLEENRIDTILANAYKTKIIAHKQRR